MSYPYLIQGDNIVVVIKNQSHTIGKTHIAYEKIKQAIKDGDWAAVDRVINPVKVVLDYGRGKIAVQGSKVFWEGVEMHNALTRRMLAMLQDEFPIEPLVLFMEHLMENPSYRAVNETYEFLEKNQLPITPDGCFLAYKKVRADFKDVHSGTVLNKPAYAFTDEEMAALPIKGGAKGEVVMELVDGVTVVSMPRNQVNDDKTQTCSEGLHFCSQDYLGHFGGERVLILKINPRDVVSIPTDYNRSKGRACSYQIVGELGVDPDEAFTAPVQSSANG
jgi:hypothetical protein